MSKRLLVLCLFILCVLSTSAMLTKGVQSATGHHDHMHVPSYHNTFIVSIPGLSFQELAPDGLEQYPHFHRLSEQGMVGALNVRTPYKGIEDSYLTIGAGAIATSKPEYGAWQRYEQVQGVEAGVLYERYTGHRMARIVVPQYYAIAQLNKATTYKATLGLLADRLERSGVTVALYGNRDRGLHSGVGESSVLVKRDAAMMLMNSQGAINQGEIGAEVVESDKLRPYGVKTHYELIVRQVTSLPRPAVVMVELGDLERLYAERASYVPERFARLKKELMTEIDAMIGHIVLQMNADDMLLVFSPQVHAVAERDKLLFSPIIAYRPNGTQGILSSGTTQREGIVAHVDIAPTILRAHHIAKPAEMIGFPFTNSSTSKVNDEQWAWLYDEVQAAAKVYLMRPQVLYCYVVLLMLSLIMGLVTAIFSAPRLARIISVLLLATLVAPLVLLYFSVTFQIKEPLVIVMLFVAICMIIAILLLRFTIYRALLMLSVATVFVLAVDGLSGARWMQRSVLGYDAMIGARYYGIGNEYAGVLIGAVVLLVSLCAHMLYERYPKVVMGLSCTLFVATIVYLLAPSFGTNAGAAIAATVTFGIAALRMFAGKVLKEVRWHRLALAIVMLGIIAFIGLWLANGSSSQSHIGRAMQLVASGDFDAIMAIISRKLSMNWHLIGVSSWSKVLMMSLIVIAAIVLRPRGVFAEWQTWLPMVMYGFSANAIGALVILIVNDSGIVAAATMIIYAAVPMLLIKLYDMSFSQRS